METNRLISDARVVTRNTLINLAGQIAPAMAALLATPFLVRGWSIERYALFTLGLLGLQYLTMLDLGLGRSTTKLIAESVTRNETDRVAATLGVSLCLLFTLGLIGATILAISARLLVSRVFQIPAELQREALISIRILCATLPLTLCTTTLRGALEAKQRFDLVTIVQVFSASSIYVIPAVCVALRTGLVAVFVSITIARVAVIVVLWILIQKAFPELRYRLSFDRRLFRPLIQYGVWISVSTVVSPIIVNLSRLAVGILLPVAATAYYVAPLQIVSAIWLLPVSLAAPLFPAFTALSVAASVDRDRVEELYTGALKCFLLLLGPVVLLAVMKADLVLKLWLGADFALHGAKVFQVLLVGNFVNCFAWIPVILLQAFGRPDATAKAHLLELPLTLALTWVLTSAFGIMGAAWAWTLRLCLDAVLLFWFCWRFNLVRVRAKGSDKLVIGSALLAGMGVLAWAILASGAGPTWQIAGVLCLLCGFFSASWKFLLDVGERSVLLFTVGKSFKPNRSQSVVES